MIKKTADWILNTQHKCVSHTNNHKWLKTSWAGDEGCPGSQSYAFSHPTNHRSIFYSKQLYNHHHHHQPQSKISEAIQVENLNLEQVILLFIFITIFSFSSFPWFFLWSWIEDAEAKQRNIGWGDLWAKRLLKVPYLDSHKWNVG